MARIAGRFARVEPLRRVGRLVLGPGIGPAAQKLLDQRRVDRKEHPGRHAAPTRTGQAGRRPGRSGYVELYCSGRAAGDREAADPSVEGVVAGRQYARHA